MSENTDLDRNLSDQWDRTVDICCNSLEKFDMRQVLTRSSWESLTEQMDAGQCDLRVSKELVMLKTGLTKVQMLLDISIHQLMPRVETSIIWGYLRLIIQLVQDESEVLLPRLPQMLRELFSRIEVLNNYYASLKSSKLEAQLKESCIESAIGLLSFLAETVKLIRNGYLLTNVKEKLGEDWNKLEQHHAAALATVESSILRMEAAANIDQRRTSRNRDDSATQSATLSVTSSHTQHQETAKLPCIIRPTSVLTSRFFDRTDVIDQMNKFFGEADLSEEFKSLAIHGLGGVGKSYIAMRFAEEKLRKDELDAFFWVYAETTDSLRQSFTDIALRLKLPEALQGDHDVNQALVLDWLQLTRCRWLIVYDNAVNQDLLEPYWPKANCGQAIVTARNHSFAFRPADGGLEIASWDDETGSQFLLHLLQTDISKEMGKGEASSAQRLSHRLSGHALAISNMAGLIHEHSLSVSEFMEFYDKHANEIHGPSSNQSINALWDFSFRSLDSQCRHLLSVFCFFSPDYIPQCLFEASDPANYPESLRFCCNHFQFSKVFGKLINLALIKRDRESRMFSMHRLVQQYFKYYLKKEERQESFNNAVVLVSNLFPRRDTNIAQLYLKWERCALYLPHVLNLKDCFREERELNPAFRAQMIYSDLNNACQRYLLELSSFDTLQDLIEINAQALQLLPPEEQTVALQGSITSHKGQVLMILGNYEEGIEWLKKSYETRSHDSPFNARESAWAAANAANGFATQNDWKEAIKWQNLARDLWLSWSSQQSGLTDSWPQDMKMCMAITLFWAGDYAEAQKYAEMAMKDVEQEKPFQWAQAAYTHFLLGNLDRRSRNFAGAEAHFMEAQNLWLEGKQLRTDPIHAACMFKLGCISLDEGKVEAAIKHLRDAMAITIRRKSSLRAEHMRCLFKLSEALEQDFGHEQEAASLLAEAERFLRNKISDDSRFGGEGAYDSLVFMLWR